MDIAKTLELLNAAGYRVEFLILPAELGQSPGPAVSVIWDGNICKVRGVDPADALRGAVEYVTKEIEGKRITELKRRGELHAALKEQLA